MYESIAALLIAIAMGLAGPDALEGNDLPAPNLWVQQSAPSIGPDTDPD